ncbi:hypothetical protein [Gordonia sp. (in: high G+C Gram-positive bacteria)]|uniref:hypothetical protein n=1 Tax=Gordonia sp. (in: high G+C Gram-positive bacteria) TaxID=84139 RepID=UPI0016B3C9EA|nr:hypothetical protein [Gordonia sp. (in: high G+C Gram-positive bacteria)]NLG47251.1 hypothetical protein [Gordonia sp. (in: high G+C Gram-positive bacteria)]
MTWVTWVIAALCAAAVGARLGRLTVRPPSLARSSVAVAAVAVAAAAAVRTPTVALILGPVGSNAAVLTFVGCWVVVATATALIALSALPKLGARPLGAAAVAVSALAVADVVAMAVTGETMIGALFIVLSGIFSIGVGLRYAAWNPLGRAIAFYLFGLAIMVAVLVVAPTEVEPMSGWWAAAIIILSAACCSVMVESWAVARLDLRRTVDLHRALIAAHPELADPDYRSATPVLQANDRVSEILDGLYLHAGAGLVPAEGSEQSTERPRARARQIARWLKEDEVTLIDPDVLSTPDGVSDRAWVRLIAREFDRTP